MAVRNAYKMSGDQSLNSIEILTHGQWAHLLRIPRHRDR
jgi:hypothetical protein